MKRLILGLAILCSLILPAGVLAAAGFSAPLLIGDLLIDEDGIGVGSSDPRICSGTNNAIYVVWRDEDETGATGIYFTRSLDGGATFQEKRRIDYSGADEGEDLRFSDPEIGVDSEGSIVIIYSKSDTRDGGQFSLVLNKSQDAGDSFESQTVFSAPYGILDGEYFGAFSPDLVIAGSEIYYSWGDMRNVYLARMVGEDNMDVIPLSREDENPGDLNIKRGRMYPSFAMDSEGNIYAVHFENNSDTEENPEGLYDLFFAKLENEQNTFSGFKMVAKCDSWMGSLIKPSIMITSTGTLVVAWNKGARSLDDSWGGKAQPLYSALSDDGGVTFSEPLEINFGEEAYVQKMSMTIDPNDSTHFLYRLSSNGSLHYGKSSDLLNSFDPVIRIHDMVYLSDMCLNENDDTVYAVWHYQGNATIPSAKEGIYFAKAADIPDDEVPDDELPDGTVDGGGGGGGGCFIHGLLD